MAYNLLKTGSSGDDVRKLQTALNNAGYNVGVDGIYGSQTAAAVKKYQQNNGLAVDGLAGTNTLTSLYGGSSAQKKETKAPAAATAPAAPVMETTARGTEYDPAKTTGTLADLAAAEAARPAAYQGTYQQQIDTLLNQVMNREPMQYDFNADPIYQNYKQQYIANGKRAMNDTMADAVALTGGYGNSYAQAAGQQAYNQYMEGLNNVIPDLYADAYNRYNDEYNRNLNALNALQAADATQYGRYSDDYQRYLDDLAYAYQKQQDEQSQQNWQKQFNAQYGKKKSSGGSGSSTKKSSGGSSSSGTTKKTETTTTTAPTYSKELPRVGLPSDAAIKQLLENELKKQKSGSTKVVK